MSAWTSDELTRIGRAEELRITSVRPDGTLRRPVPIWVARDGDDLYVRAVNGRSASWFRGVQEHHEGHIQAGGIDSDVTAEDAGHELGDRLDTAYRAKYGRYPESVVGSVVTPAARSTTLKLTPLRRD